MIGIIFSILFWLTLTYVGVVAFSVLIGGLIGSGLWDRIKSSIFFFTILFVLTKLL